MIKKITDWFLVKEIKDQQGNLHFKRWALLETPWFSFYIHYIANADKDKHPHSHPWNFRTFVIKGGYLEAFYKNKGSQLNPKVFEGRYHVLSHLGQLFGYWSDIISRMTYRNKDDYHKIVKLYDGPTWTFVWTGKRYPTWGYLVDGEHIESSTYREMKHKGELKDNIIHEPYEAWLTEKQ